MTVLDTRPPAPVLATTRPAPMIIKRDGTVAAYDLSRIRSALTRAWQRITGEVDHAALAQALAAIDAEISRRFDEDVKVYEIQSVVEHILIESGHGDVAAGYVEYRLARDLHRSQTTDVDHQIGKFLAKDAAILNENANKDGRAFHTQRDLLAGSVSKAKALSLLPPRVAQAHSKGQIHYHDLDYSLAPLSNCSLPDFAGMLARGFTLGNARVETPRSIGTAATVLSQAITAVSSSQYGGVTVETVDVLLAPYAARTYDKHLTDARRWITDPDACERFAREHTAKDIYDAMQTLEYQVNTIASVNGQTPFVTLGLGLGDSWFAREIQKAVLNVRIKGLGADGRTAIFPKLVFTIKDGLNAKAGDPNYDIKRLAIECTTKRIYPDYQSYENIVAITGSYKTPMGCRSYLQAWDDETGQGTTLGRMNLGVVTLNLPRIALEAGGDMAAFWRLLDERLDIAHEALTYRESFVRTAVPENAPILYMEGAFGKRLAAGDNVGELFDNGRGTISLGYIGLYEVARAFFGPRWEDNPETAQAAKEFTLAVIGHMKDTTLNWNENDRNGTNGARGAWISLYSTPSESLTDRFAKMDLEKFGPVSDITVKATGTYYTNSFHLDSRLGEGQGWNPFRKIDFEVDYPLAGSSGGFIHYVEVPSIRDNPRAVESIVDYAMGRGIGYFGVNTKVDHCLTCGFEGETAATENAFACPSCGEDDAARLDVTRRVCGYLAQPVARPVAKGRFAEVTGRADHVSMSD